MAERNLALHAWMDAWQSCLDAHLSLAVLGCGLSRASFSPRQWQKLRGLMLWADKALASPADFNKAFVIDKLFQLAGFRLRVDPSLVGGSLAKELAWEEFVSTHDYGMIVGYNRAAITIQRQWRTWSKRRHEAMRRIQRACIPWIVKPVTADGKPGINLRLLMADDISCDDPGSVAALPTTGSGVITCVDDCAASQSVTVSSLSPIS